MFQITNVSSQLLSTVIFLSITLGVISCILNYQRKVQLQVRNYQSNQIILKN